MKKVLCSSHINKSNNYKGRQLDSDFFALPGILSINFASYNKLLRMTVHNFDDISK